jgi:hypothetical protein
MQDNISIIPLVDILSKTFNKQVVMNSGNYIIFETKELISKIHIDVALIEQEKLYQNAIQDNLNIENKKILSDTDWYVTRSVESGIVIPDEISQARAEARASII